MNARSLVRMTVAIAAVFVMLFIPCACATESLVSNGGNTADIDEYEIGLYTDAGCTSSVEGKAFGGVEIVYNAVKTEKLGKTSITCTVPDCDEYGSISKTLFLKANTSGNVRFSSAWTTPEKSVLSFTAMKPLVKIHDGGSVSVVASGAATWDFAVSANTVYEVTITAEWRGITVTNDNLTDAEKQHCSDYLEYKGYVAPEYSGTFELLSASVKNTGNKMTFHGRLETVSDIVTPSDKKVIINDKTISEGGTTYNAADVWASDSIHGAVGTGNTSYNLTIEKGASIIIHITGKDTDKSIGKYSTITVTAMGKSVEFSTLWWSSGFDKYLAMKNGVPTAFDSFSEALRAGPICDPSHDITMGINGKSVSNKELVQMVIILV